MLKKTLSPKQEAFVQAYIKHNSATKAYAEVYATSGNANTIKRAASRALESPLVQARIAELRAETATEAKVTVLTLIAELEEAREIARKVGAPTAMVAATMGKAKLLGLDKLGDDDSDAPVARVEVTVRDARRPDA